MQIWAIYQIHTALTRGIREAENKEMKKVQTSQILAKKK